MVEKVEEEEMTEVLYCPVSNELVLFSGIFEVDSNKKTMTIYVYGRKGYGVKNISSKDLVHIGWL